MEITHDDLTRATAIARTATEGRSWHYEDVYSACCLALAVCAEKYDGRGTWSGYSGQQMKWAAAKELRRLETEAKPGGMRWAIAHPDSLDLLRENEEAA